jgi:hypothetical protein
LISGIFPNQREKIKWILYNWFRINTGNQFLITASRENLRTPIISLIIIVSSYPVAEPIIDAVFPITGFRTNQSQILLGWQIKLKYLSGRKKRVIKIQQDKKMPMCNELFSKKSAAVIKLK